MALTHLTMYWLEVGAEVLEDILEFSQVVAGEMVGS